MQNRHLTLVCDDVTAGASFFRDVLALPVRQHDQHRADVDMGPVTATLTARVDPVPNGSPPTGSGPAVIVELEVTDIPAAIGELHRRGATVLIEPVITDWGTESAFVAGPDGVIVELYRLRTPPRPPWLDDEAPR